MRWTQEQFDDYERKRQRHAELPVQSSPTTDELQLHDDIIAWCNRQQPRIKYIHARTDRKSTIGVGIHDFTLFMPGGITVKIECKTKTGKLDEDQQVWWMEMKRLGHIVFVCRGFKEFALLVTPLLAPHRQLEAE